MAKRIIMSSDHIDSQGFKMTKQALEGGAEQINGDKKLPYTVNHKRELPPIGRMVDVLVEEKEGHIYLTAEPQLYQHRKELDWDETLLIEYFDEPALFINSHENELNQTQISLDPANFTSYEAFERFNRSIHELNPEIELEIHGRKSEIPVPEIIIALGKLTVLYRLLKPFAEKMGEKFAEDVYDELKKQLKTFRDYITRVTKMTRENTVPKNKTLNTVFELTGKPQVELIAKTNDPKLLSKGLDEKRLEPVRQEIERFIEHFDVVKIQFVLTDKGRWKFTYLLTSKGESVGKKECFKERDKQYQRVVLGNG
jgi:hypothetical protein